MTCAYVMEDFMWSEPMHNASRHAQDEEEVVLVVGSEWSGAWCKAWVFRRSFFFMSVINSSIGVCYRRANLQVFSTKHDTVCFCATCE